MHWKAEPKLFLPDMLPDRNDWPTVDIILPRYKEAWESFEPTIRATIARPTSEALPKTTSLQQATSLDSSVQLDSTQGTAAWQPQPLEEQPSQTIDGIEGASQHSGPGVSDPESPHTRRLTEIPPPHLRSPISRDGRTMSTIRPPELRAPAPNRVQKSLWDTVLLPLRNVMRRSFTAVAPLPASPSLDDDASAPPSSQTHTGSPSLHPRPYTDIAPPHLRSNISRTGRTMSTIRPPQLRRRIFNRKRSWWSLFLPTDFSPRYAFVRTNLFGGRGIRSPAANFQQRPNMVPWRSTELPPSPYSSTLSLRGVKQRILTPWTSAEISRVRLPHPKLDEDAAQPLLPLDLPPNQVAPLPLWTPKAPFLPPLQEPQKEAELQPQTSAKAEAHASREIQGAHTPHMHHHELINSPSSLPSSSTDHHGDHPYSNPRPSLSRTSSPNFTRQSYWSHPIKAGSKHLLLERPPLEELQPGPSLELSSTSSKEAEPEEWHNPFVRGGVTLDYPPSKLNIYIADDGSRDPATSIHDQVQQLKASLPPGSPNVHYITRESGHNAKGGNLNNCLKHANGKLVSVLDADHVVSPEFLLWTVPHFLSAQNKQHHDVEAGGHAVERTEWSLEGNKIGLCQTKQYFYNEHDFIPTIVGADNKIYYYLYQHGLSGMDAACCVGTGYVMRRQALDSAGGYVGGFAVEDSFTSTSLIRAGWKAKYLPDCLAMGLSPPTLAEHVQQRWRWSIGNMQLFLYGDYGGLSFFQKIGVVGGNWYPLALTAVFVVILVRLACFVAYVLAAAPQQTSATQVATSWFALMVLMSLPNIGFLGKIFDIIGIMILIPVFLPVVLFGIMGRLNPEKKALPKIKAASEAQGEVQLPPNVLASTLIITCIMVAAILLMLLSPENANVELGFALTTSLLAMFAIIVIPIYLIVFHSIALKFKRKVRRTLRRKGMLGNKRPSKNQVAPTLAPTHGNQVIDFVGQSFVELDGRRVGE
ncbi:hypothetical protein DUNSADRAFT_6022 [Dunaliella salina]|nr:hypothetical protein DUNSADRAFT_6022 [Dunaliella salina]|eukprot:KAF5836387.1 hypothetical protein DUNSADRAFT_6022 [Dunaliella salina]